MHEIIVNLIFLNLEIVHEKIISDIKLGKVT